jgi:S1-C subfamily serine protease
MSVADSGPRPPLSQIVATKQGLFKWLAVIAVGSTGFSQLEAQTISFAASTVQGGKASTSSCVLLDDQGTLATVVELGSDANKAVLHAGDKKVPLKFVVKDADSRVAIYRMSVDSADLLKSPAGLGSSHALGPADKLYGSATERTNPSRLVCRVKRFQGKVLPLAVLRVNHPASPPAVGSGIYNGKGELVGLLRQDVYNAKKSSYCLPVEVITRILKDHKLNERVSRCWIGIIMDQQVASPIVESVRPGSPASQAGLRKGDIIVSIGGRNVSEYAEVVDAFYYLVSGVAEKFRVLRGTEVMEFEVVPQTSPGS